MPKKIVIDAGHGGFDPGAVYGRRLEKDDNLRLALAVGENLENAGYDIVYTRTDDRYDSPYDKAQIANNAKGELFLSFHRNFAEREGLYQGVQALVYDKDPLALAVSKAINEQLEQIGFQNLGIESRKELVVLRRTAMPAVLMEVGFINSAIDNQLFDENFDAIASAIAAGVMIAFPNSGSTSGGTSVSGGTTGNGNNGGGASADSGMMNGSSNSVLNQMQSSLASVPCELPPSNMPPSTPTNPNLWYYVQVGLYRYPENAVYLMEKLAAAGYTCFWRRVDCLIGIWVGPVRSLDEAVALEKRLEADGYDTLIVTGEYMQK